MKKGWDRYAIEKRYIKKGYLRKYRNGNPSWKTPEASGSNSIQQSRQKQEEIITITGQQHESIGEENSIKTHQEGRQGVQGSDQGRCETEETNSIKKEGKIMKKQSLKEKKHEAKETKAYEKKEDKKESKSKKK